jgi:hypothetical protein
MEKRGQAGPAWHPSDIQTVQAPPALELLHCQMEDCVLTLLCERAASPLTTNPAISPLHEEAASPEPQ